MFYVDDNNRKTQLEHPRVSEAQMEEQDLIVSAHSDMLDACVQVLKFRY